jgi:nicotinate dehydrogenase subunit B
VTSVELNESIKRNPLIDTWIKVDRRETITIFTGKVELGQGLVTALARIAAEELDVALDRIVVRTADTLSGPNEGLTAGSQSMVTSGNAVRQAAAECRRHLLTLAAARLEAPIEVLSVSDGTITAPDGTRTDYWELSGGRPLGFAIRGDVAPKDSADYRLVGKRDGGRIDLRGLVDGTTRFVADLAPPGVLHARVLQPPSPTAELIELDLESARSLPGVVQVLKDGGFVAVAAEREEHAIRALDLLAARASWQESPRLPAERDLGDWLLEQPTESVLIVDGVPAPDRVIPPPVGFDDADARVEGRFVRPFQLHGSIGPSAALAEWRDGTLTVWTHSQSVPLLRLALAEAHGLDPSAVRTVHVPGPGCYGHNGADDAAYDASALALTLPDRPILLKWTRADEHTCEPFAAAAVVRVSASIDGTGRLASWDLEANSTTHIARAVPHGERTAFASAWRRGKERPPTKPLLQPEAGIHRNATPAYRTQARRIVKHLIPESPLRTSAIRGLGAYINIFAIESMMDELADAAGVGPVEFRLAHLDDERARDVLNAAAARIDWDAGNGEFGRGTGIAYARYKNSAAYAAVAATVLVDDATAQISVERIVVAADAGQVIDPEGLTNQLEGGAIQSTSWTLKEEVTFDSTRVTSVDWESYPILTFSEVPEIETVLIDRPGSPFLGAGEATQGPTVGAIANAVRAAIGVRLYELPFTPDKVRAAVAAA